MAKNYYCPGFFENAIMYRELEYYRRHFPDTFVDNAKITHVYGCFPSCIWNGGGCWVSIPAQRYIIRDCLNWWKNETEVIIQLTFTNPIVVETDIYDRYSNAILDVAVETLGYDRLEVLVSSPILEKYIREKYPNINITKSIIGMTGDEKQCVSIADYVEQLNIYPKIVIPRKKVNDKDFILNFPQELKNKVELLCTDPCDINCPRLYSHYKDMAKEQLWEEVSKERTYCSLFTPNEPYRMTKYLIYQITPAEVEAYEALGWSEFKISGRVSSSMAPLQVVPYLVKPEYSKDLLYNIYTAIYGEDAVIPHPSFWNDPIPRELYDYSQEKLNVNNEI